MIHSRHFITVCGVPTASKTAWTMLVLPVASSPWTIIVGGLGMAGWHWVSRAGTDKEGAVTDPYQTCQLAGLRLATRELLIYGLQQSFVGKQCIHCCDVETFLIRIS